MKVFKKIYDAIKRDSSDIQKLSFSQCGEDMIIDFIFNALKIENVQYFDIGAHHPSYLSNTYHFYLKGNRGVCVEPDPQLCQKIIKERPLDTILNIGIGVTTEAEADFYVMTSPSLNTFSRQEAERYQEYGTQCIESVLKIPLIPINDLLEKHFTRTPDFISLDVEGLDFKILQSLDFQRYRPTVFCVETLTYTENNTEEKLYNIIDFLSNKDYMVYADTFINTIFVDRTSWKNRSRS